ncbi:Yip1 family protein [Domibacillus robiginosus]|uniref:Yip1 family protein n=1 Tax=Domibacillus robiginosus TaxID=1071054 RepID=UPI00067C68E4|nr:Yip1 family protein [Domibacillus robiginosus]
MTEKTVVPTGPKPSLFRFITGPVEQFKRMRERPVIWIPGLIVFLFFTAATMLTALLPESVGALESSGLSAEQAQNIAMITTAVSSIFIFPLTVIISAGISLLLVKLAGGETTFKRMVTFSLFIMFITTIGQIINLGVAVAAGTDPNVTSLNGLLGLEGTAGGILSAFEIFTIWSVILTGIGLPIVTGMSKRAGWIIAGVLFLLTLGTAIVTGSVY